MQCKVMKIGLVTLTGLGALLATMADARASLTLTASAAAAGFKLSTFADGFPVRDSVGPLGIGFVSGGGVIVSDDPGNVRVFPTDTNGQHAGSVPVAQNYGAANALGIAQVGQTFYMAQQGTGDVVQINANGTFNQVIVSGIPFATGIVTDPANGHLFVSNDHGQIFDVDPIAKTKILFASVKADGLATDGTTLYATINGNQVIGIKISDHTTVFTSPGISLVDGIALGTGSLAGNIFVNTNIGNLIEVNLKTDAETLIAHLGSRGDFVAVDPNGTLLITQTDRIERLTAPNGGGFGGGVPEPATVALLGVGLVGLGLLRRRLA